MAIYGVGAYYGGDKRDVSDQFIAKNLIGTGWEFEDAPELREYFRSLKVGDIVYIKVAAFGREKIGVKGIGIIRDEVILGSKDTDSLVTTGRNVIWLSKEHFDIPRPTEKNNVRSNTVYEEFHPAVLKEIISKIKLSV